MAVATTKCSNCGCEHKVETDRVKDWAVKKCFNCGETVKFKVKAEAEIPAEVTLEEKEATAETTSDKKRKSRK